VWWAFGRWGGVQVRHNRNLTSLLQAICEKVVVAGLEVMFEEMFLRFLVHFLPNCQTVMVGACEEVLYCFAVATHGMRGIDVIQRHSGCGSSLGEKAICG